VRACTTTCLMTPPGSSTRCASGSGLHWGIFFPFDVFEVQLLHLLQVYGGSWGLSLGLASWEVSLCSSSMRFPWSQVAFWAHRYTPHALSLAKEAPGGVVLVYNAGEEHASFLCYPCLPSYFSPPLRRLPPVTPPTKPATTTTSKSPPPRPPPSPPPTHTHALKHWHHRSPQPRLERPGDPREARGRVQGHARGRVRVGGFVVAVAVFIVAICGINRFQSRLEFWCWRCCC